MLKDQGYRPAQLYLVGDYRDPVILALLLRLGRGAMLQAAFAEYGQNARYPRPDGKVEGPDGELVTIFDAEAGF